MKVNGCSITSCYGHYNLMGWLMLLRFSNDSRGVKLEQLGWADEADASSMDFTGPSNFKKRYELLKESKYLKIISPLFLPLHLQPRYLPPLINLSYTFHLASDKQVIKTECTSFEVGFEIRNFKFHSCKIIVDPTVALSIESKLMKTPMNYPIFNWRLTSLNVPAGLINWSQEDVFFQSQTPEIVYLMIQPQVSILQLCATCLCAIFSLSLSLSLSLSQDSSWI